MFPETNGNAPSGPLTGLRVTDFTWVVAGPFCTRALADMGAEVIKIEARIRPDPMRNTVNSYDDLDSPFPYGAFDSYNRNKLGAAVNARHPEGLKLIKNLIAVSDAVTENFRGGVLERWGLSYEEIAEMMGCPIGTVRSRIFRAREAIAAKLRPLLDTPEGKRW